MIKEFLKEKTSNKVFQNYIYLLLIQGANFILPLVTFPYLVRVLESEKYGLVMIAQSVAIFFTIIVDFGFSISATREVSKLSLNKKKLSEYYWSVLLIKIFLLIISFLILLLLVNSVDKFIQDPLVYLFSFGLVLGQGIFPTWFFQGIEKMQIISFINISAKVFFTLAIFVFILKPDDYIYVPILNGTGFIISGFVGFVYSIKFVNFYVPKFKDLLPIIKESSSLLVSNLAVSLYTSSNVLVLGFFGGDIIAGVYASIEKLITASKSLYIPLYQALFPNLSKKTPKEIFFFIKKIFLPISIIGLLVVVIIVLNAKKILDFIYNDEFISSYSFILQIIGTIALISALNMLFVTLYFPAIKKYKLRVKILVFSGIFHIFLTIFLAKYFDILGVACAAVITEILILIYSFFLYKNKT